MKNWKVFLITILVLGFNVGHAQSGDVKKWTLEECVLMAQKNNLDVRDSRLGLKNSEYSLDQSNWNQLPSLNASGGYGFNWGRSIDPTTNQFRTERINSIGVSLNGNYTIFNGLQTRKQIDQNKAAVIASEYDVETAENNIALTVANSFLNVVQNKELLQNNELQQKNAEEQYERTKVLVRAGSLPKANEFDLASQLATAELNVITAENNLALSLLNLKQLLQIPASEPFDVAIPEVENPEEDVMNKDPNQIFETATTLLPQLKAAEYNERSAIYGQKVAKSGYSPSLSLSGRVNSNYSSAADQVNAFTPDGYPVGEQLNDNVSQNLSLNLSIPIFNNLQTRIGVQRAKIDYERSQINKDRVNNSVRNDIEQAYNNVVASAKTFQARQKQVDALREAYRVTEKRYNLGVTNSVDYQVAVNNLNSAETDLVRAKYNYIFSLKVLDFYEGKPLY